MHALVSCVQHLNSYFSPQHNNIIICCLPYIISSCGSAGTTLGGYRESSHGMKELLNLPPLVLKARHLSGSAFRWDQACLSRQWDGNPLGLELVAEDKPSEFSCMHAYNIIAITYVPITIMHTMRFFKMSSALFSSLQSMHIMQPRPVYTHLGHICYSRLGKGHNNLWS